MQGTLLADNGLVADKLAALKPAFDRQAPGRRWSVPFLPLLDFICQILQHLAEQHALSIGAALH